MLERLKPERHISAMMTLETIKFIKDECNEREKCAECRFADNKNQCCFCYTPADWNEYELTERIYK